jgi:hypothetical protein
MASMTLAVVHPRCLSLAVQYQLHWLWLIGGLWQQMGRVVSHLLTPMLAASQLNY